MNPNSGEDEVSASDRRGMPQSLRALLSRLEEEDCDLPDPTTLPPAEGRRQVVRASGRWRRSMPEVAGSIDFAISSGDGTAMRCRRLDPPERKGAGAILFVHGGGWAFCDIDTHEDPMRRLCVETGRPVFGFDYRLAPEHPYPAGLDDCRAAWSALLSGKMPGAPDRGPFILVGDSAGANLGAALLLAELDQRRPAPDAAVLVYGVFGSDFGTSSYGEFADGPLLTRAKMQRYWDWYCPMHERGIPYVTPLCASDDQLRRLPPVLIVAAEFDPLRSDSERLAERLRKIGRDHDFVVWRGLVHGSLQMGGDVPEVRDRLHEVSGWIDRAANLASLSAPNEDVKSPPAGAG